MALPPNISTQGLADFRRRGCRRPTKVAVTNHLWMFMWHNGWEVPKADLRHWPLKTQLSILHQLCDGIIPSEFVRILMNHHHNPYSRGVPRRSYWDNQLSMKLSTHGQDEKLFELSFGPAEDRQIAKIVAPDLDTAFFKLLTGLHGRAEPDVNRRRELWKTLKVQAVVQPITASTKLHPTA